MDINKATLDMKSILRYLKQLESSDARMYEKSKSKLRDLADLCLESAKSICGILAGDVLETDYDEFEGSGDISQLTRVMSELNTTYQSLSNLTSGPASPVLSHEDDDSQISVSVRRQVMATYAHGLKAMAEENIPYPAVKDCAALLWRWFNCRFNQNQTTRFYYNIRRVSTWVRDIVVVYSKSLQSGSVHEFIRKFYLWCEELESGQGSTSYAVPYEIYEFDRMRPPSTVTLCAAVMWDILYNHGLSSMCGAGSDDLLLREDMVYKLCGELNPESLNDYSNYVENPEVLTKCGILTRGKEMSES